LRHLISVESSGIFSNVNKSTHILLYLSPEIVSDEEHGQLHFPSPRIPISPSSVQHDDSLIINRTSRFNIIRCCAFILPYCMCTGASNIITVPAPTSLAHLTASADLNTCSAIPPKRSVLLLSNPLGDRSDGNTYSKFQKLQANTAFKCEKSDVDLNEDMYIHFIETSNRSVLLNDDIPYVNPGNGNHCLPLPEKKFCIIERTTILTSIDEVMPIVKSEQFMESKLNDNVRNSCYEVKTIECFGIRILICTPNTIERNIEDVQNDYRKVDGEIDYQRRISDSLSAWKQLCIFSAIGFEQNFIPTINLKTKNHLGI
jgi:hypothetical protein